jgi:O-antigen/teichoic acid export membrane protein
MRRLLNRDLLEVAAAKLVPAVAGVTFVALASRLFPAADYGHFAIAFASANLVAVIGVVWLSQAVLRFGSSRFGRGPVWKITVLAGGCASAACVVFTLLLQPQPATDVRLPAALGVVFLAVSLALNTVAAAYGTALQQFRAYRRAEVARGVLLVALLSASAIVPPGQGALMLVLAYAAATLLPSLALLATLAAQRDDAPSNEGPLGWAELVRSCAAYGWPMTVWAGLQASQALIERNVVGNALGADAFGRFIAAADIITRGLGLAMTPVVTYVHARLMASAGTRERLDSDGRALLGRGATLMLVSGAVMMLALAMLQDLLGWLVPSIRTLDATTLWLLCAAALAWALALLAHKPLELAKRTLEMSVLLAVAVAAQWWLLTATVGRWGVRAMPTASIVAAFLYVAGCLWLSRRDLRT